MFHILWCPLVDLDETVNLNRVLAGNDAQLSLPSEGVKSTHAGGEATSGRTHTCVGPGCGLNCEVFGEICLDMLMAASSGA